jgi:glycosyltransferase involved in cell wall biosynthesis
MKNREEVAYFLSSCDIIVNPSFQEGLPTTILE